jgi:ABC-type transporter Mla MlaB component
MASEYFAVSSDCLFISGKLHLHAANLILNELKILLQNNQIKQVDFKAVESCDTTAVLILFAIKRQVKSSFALSNIPEKLFALLQLSNLTSIFK